MVSSTAANPRERVQHVVIRRRVPKAAYNEPTYSVNCPGGGAYCGFHSVEGVCRKLFTH